VAKREFREATGFEANGKPVDLGEVKQPGNVLPPGRALSTIVESDQRKRGVFL